VKERIYCHNKEQRRQPRRPWLDKNKEGTHMLSSQWCCKHQLKMICKAIGTNITNSYMDIFLENTWIYLTQWRRVPLEKLRVTQIVKKFTFYGTQRFITKFTTAHQWAPIPSQMHPVHTFPPYFLKIHSNNSQLSMPRSCKCDQNFAYISHLSHVCYMPHPCHPSWFDPKFWISCPFSVTYVIPKNASKSEAWCNIS
jgi:hypothetical protein